MGATVTGPHCRHCKRPIYRLTDGSWTLVYVEYADPWRCDARGDKVVLSGLGHEPPVPRFNMRGRIVNRADFGLPPREVA